MLINTLWGSILFIQQLLYQMFINILRIFYLTVIVLNVNQYSEDFLTNCNCIKC